MESDSGDSNCLTSILRRKNEESASLILMVLCDDSLVLHELESESDNKILESRLEAVTSISSFESRADICEASKKFRGTYFTQGDVISFISPNLYDICACALYEENPRFILKYCTLRFLHDRFRTQPVPSLTLNNNQQIIYVPLRYHDIIVTRLAEGIAEGKYSMSVVHPALQDDLLVDGVFQELEMLKTRPSGIKRARTVAFESKIDQGKYLLQWAVKAHSLYLVQKIIKSGYNFSVREIIKGFYTCSVCDNVSVMEYLFMEHGTILSQSNVTKAFNIAADSRSIQVVPLLILNGACFSNLSFHRQKKLFDTSVSQENTRVCGSVLTYILRNSPVVHAVAETFRTKQACTFRSICNELLHIACQSGNMLLAQFISGSSDINYRDKHGYTPVMYATITGRKDVFDFVTSKGADLTLTDNNGDTVIHHACRTGDKYIVEQLLQSLPVDLRGECDWTPLMNAAYSGKKEIFDIIMQHGPNLKLTDILGDTVLHFACRGGDVSIVEFLLPSFDINNRGTNGWTPLMKASYHGHKAIFDTLEAKGADITLTDNLGDTVLHLACQGGNSSIVKHMLPTFDINCLGEYGRTPIMKACFHGKKKIFDILLSKGADLTLTDTFGDTLFHLACWGGSTSIVDCLLSSFDINIRGANEWTPLMRAVDSGEKDVVEILVTNGADVTLTNDCSDTAFHRACWKGHVAIVEYLLPGFPVDCEGQQKWTPVMQAALSGKLDVFNLLVTNGASLTLTDHCNDNLLHIACRGGSALIVEHLLQSFDINCRGAHNKTPVMYAAESCQNEIFDFLVSKGADLTTTDEHGDTVLHYACHGGNVTILEEILSRLDINIRGDCGLTPLMAACYSGKEEVFKLLVEKGADLTLTDNEDDTVLHLACREGTVHMIEHLLPLFDINVKGQEGLTPVMCAAGSGRREIVDLLVTKGADLSLTDDDGDIILHHAPHGGNPDIVQCFLPLCDLNVRGLNGQTPLMCAVSGVHTEVFEMLISSGADSSVVDNDGDTLLHLACENDSLDMVKCVLPLCGINSRNKLGWSPAMVATIRRQKDVFQYLADNGADLTLVDNAGDCMLILAYRGGCSEIIHQLNRDDEEVQQTETWTDLMLHLVYGHFSYISEYKPGDPELVQRDGFGDTLLHLACRGGNTECVQHLLPCYDINVRGRAGWTPAMMAARCGHLDVLKCLFSLEAEIGLVSERGEDVFSLAVKGKHEEVVTYLKTISQFKNRD